MRFNGFLGTRIDDFEDFLEVFLHEVGDVVFRIVDNKIGLLVVDYANLLEVLGIPDLWLLTDEGDEARSHDEVRRLVLFMGDLSPPFMKLLSQLSVRDVDPPLSEVTNFRNKLCLTFEQKSGLLSQIFHDFGAGGSHPVVLLVVISLDLKTSLESDVALGTLKLVGEDSQNLGSTANYLVDGGIGQNLFKI